MRPEDYPPQEPFSEMAHAYVEDVTRLGEGVTPTAEVRYGDDPYQSIAVHAAPDPSGDVLIFAHGGGWTSGYKENMNFMAPALTARGVTFCSIGYRLAPQHLFPTGLNDFADAVAWIHGHVSEYGGDPARLYIGGHSAGGHYAPLLAVTSDWRAARGLPDDVIRGCLPISGVYKFGEGSGLSMRPRFLGPESAETDRTASPLDFVSGDAPPFLISYGTEDFPHLRDQAEAMAQALTHAGVETEVIVFDGRNHFGACMAGGEAHGPWVGSAADWMATH